MAPKEAEKRKAEATEEESPAKEAKTEEEKKVPEKKEAFVEPDAPEDKRPAIKETVGFDPRDTTLNVIPAMGGKMLMMLSEGGMQYLLAGARANAGAKAGRYMYEVKIVEVLASSAAAAGGGRSPSLVKNLTRIGFSTGSSALYLGGCTDKIEDGVCFDSDGFFFAPEQKKKETFGQKFGKDNVMALVLNLEPESPNYNTVQLFKDGKKASKPVPLPESLQGVPLYPHVAYRNASLQINFGPEALQPLPFDCRTWQSAAGADMVVEPSSKPKDGKFDVVFPVGVPDEGTFPWLEEFMKENPQYVELSDRKIVEWAQKSGLWKPKGNSLKNSNDKPDFNFGVAGMDDLSPCKVIQIAAPLVPRHYLVMEVRGNLTPSIRKDTLKRFKQSHYKRIAKVVVGAPNKEYQQKVLAMALKTKQDKLNSEFKAKKAEKERKKQIAVRQKQLVEARKAAEEAAKKKKEIEAEKKAALIAKKKADMEAAAARKAEQKRKEQDEKEEAEEAEAEGDEEMTEEAKAEAAEKRAKRKEERAEAEAKRKEEEEQKAADAAKAAEEKLAKETEAKKVAEEKKAADDKKAEEERKAKEEADKKEEEEEATEPPVAELTEEEKKNFFPKRDNTDLTTAATSSGFVNFALPAADEGFDKVDYVWGNAAAAKEYLRSWVADRKVATKIEDLQPSEWFKTKQSEFQAALQAWQLKQKDFKSDKKKMAAVKKRDQKYTEELTGNKKEEEKADDKAEEKEDVEMKDGEEAEKAEDGEAAAEEEEEAEEIKGDASAKVVVKDVTDLNDMGNGEPLFLHFAFEDWALLGVRYEMHLLAQAYLHDTGDPERIGIHESHLGYYYSKYYKKQLNTKFYGADTLVKLVTEMLKDTVAFDEKHNVLMSQLKGDNHAVDIFVKLTEETRRDRQRRLDAGDETAKLKFNVMQQASTPALGKKTDDKSAVADSKPKAGAGGWRAGKDGGAGGFGAGGWAAGGGGGFGGGWGKGGAKGGKGKW